MKHLFLILAASIALSACQAPRPRTEARLVYLGNDHLVGEARARQQALDHQYCHSEGQLAFTQVQRQVAPDIAASQQRDRARRFPQDSGSTTEFTGRTSDGVTYSGTARTTPNSSGGFVSPYQAYEEGRLRGQLERAPRDAAAATYIRCMSSKGWLIQREPVR